MNTTWIKQEMAGDSTPLSAEEEKALFCRWHCGDESASDEIILRNRRFVLSLVLKYRNYDLDGQELFHEGVLGLYDAMDSFDVSLGYRFATYANSYIIHRISKYIADYTNIRDVSLDQSSNDEDENALIDKIPADTSEDEIASEDRKLYEAILALEQVEKDVILLHYGFTDQGVLSLDQISRALAMSTGKVRMIHSAAKRKLRQRLGPG